MADVMRNGCRAGRSVMDVSPTQRAQGQSGRAGESGPADLCAKAWGGPLLATVPKNHQVFLFIPAAIVKPPLTERRVLGSLSRMPFKRQVQVGRVALINYGPDAGKLCTIINVIDQNKVLVDGPEAVTGCHRHEVGIKRIALTDLTVPVTLNATHK